MSKDTKQNEQEAPVTGIVATTAKTGEGKEATLNYNYGKDLKEAVTMFGEEVIFTNYRKSAKIDLQSVIRRYLVAGKEPNDLMTIWRPGVTLDRTVDPKAAAKNAFAKMTDEEKKAFITELKNSL
jgi:hypothetical protein